MSNTAERIRQARTRLEKAAPDSGADRIETAPETLPSHAQERMWVLDHLHRDQFEYNSHVLVRLRGPLHMESLRRGFAFLVKRHDVLRTVFEDRDGVPHPVVQEGAPFSFEVIELGPEVPRDEREATAVAAARAGVLTPIDLVTGPILRVRLVRAAPEEHVLAIIVHHIATDGWSMQVLCEELGVAYTAFAEGRSVDLPLLPVRYRDFAWWQRTWLTEERTASMRDYWRRTLAGAIPTELMGDRPRPKVLSGQGESVAVNLSEETTGAIERLAQQRRCTTFMVLLAAFQTVLRRFTGYDDIVVGTPTAGRTKPELEKLVGFFINAVVLRTDLSGDPTFIELLDRVRVTTLGAYAHQELPFEALLDELRPERDLGRDPLFQIEIALNGEETAGLAMRGLDVERIPADVAPGGLDLRVEFTRTCNGYSAEAQFATDLFDRATIERVVCEYSQLLERAAAHPDLRLSELVREDHEGRSQPPQPALDAAGSTSPPERCLHELVLEQAQRTPDAVALAAESGAWTYAEVERSSGGLASVLRRHGVGPDVPVGVWMQRSAEVVVALLGTLRAGGAYVPVDPDVPHQRVVELMRAAGVRVLLCEPGWGAQLNLPETTVIQLDGATLRRHAESHVSAPPPGTTPDNLVSVYYTSGSTGAPKGVASTHAGWVNRMRWMQDRYGLRHGEKVLHKTVLSFDDSAVEVFWPLTVGGQVVVLPPGLHRDPRAILRTTVECRVAVVQFVPSVLALFLDEIGPDHEKDLAALRVVVSSGEALQPELVAKFYERFPTGCGLHNQYGPTEASIDSTAYRCAPEDGRGPAVPVGRALSNYQVFVLDSDLEPVPVGAPGEIFLGGIGLARGYLADPARTAEAFVPSPYVKGARLYRTGDRGRWLANGELLCLGRSDHQVKIRGVRIEPGEIEHALRQHPGVADALVVKWEPDPGDVRLAAYVIAVAAVTLDPGELTRDLGLRFPDYMVPGAITPIEAFPLTPSGKVDRKRLPTPEARSGRARQVNGPRNEAEAMVAQVWAEVLKQDAIDIDDDFFAIGGHSLLATKVIARLRRRLDAEIPLSLLFEHPTVSRLSTALNDARGGGEGPRVVPRQGETSPLSYMQQQLWIIDQLRPGRNDYNLPEVLRLRGSLDHEALRESVRHIVERHHVLRSRVIMEGGTTLLGHLPAEAFTVAYTDLSGIDREVAELRASDMTGELVSAPFDLGRGPFIRARLIRLAGDDHILAIVIHHIATDAWSMGLLWQELSTAYVALSAHDQPTLEPLPVQYADFAHWQREWLSDQRLESMLDYWRDRLEGATATELPSRQPRPSELSGRGGRVKFTLEPELSAALRRLADEHNTTLYAVLLAAFNVLLQRHSGRDDIIVGSPSAGRERPEVENLIGFFVNTLVLRTDLSGDPSVAEFLERVRTTVLGAVAHQEVPFERIVREIRPDRDGSRNPLFQLAFTLRNEVLRADADGALRLPGVDVEELPVNDSSVFDLDMGLVDRGDRVDGEVVYAVELFDGDMAEALVRRYMHVLAQFVDNPRQRLSDLAVVTTEERRVVESLNDTERAWPEGGRCLHELVEAQVGRSPDATAVVFGGEAISYRELNADANRLARHLRSLGVGPERLVGVVMGRSAQLVVALLAVLKAGGAFIPLDPRHPSERIGLMLADSGVSCVLTDQERMGSLKVSPGVATVAVDEIAAPWHGADDEDQTVGVTADNLAYCIFTSGSTGRPKAVMVTHRGIVNTVADLVERCRIGSGDTVGAAITVAFDLALAELLAPLTCGATVVVVDEDSCRDAHALARVAEAHPFTVVIATPATWRGLVEADWSGGEVRAITGGEALAPELADRIGERVSDLWNFYGPTEISVYATAERVRRETADSSPIPIGKPIVNARVHVLDDDLRLTPPGLLGELFIGGAGVTRGYANRPGLTAERYLPDPFHPGERLYRTGDLVRQQGDGTLEFFGRNDHQVKINGHRIELGEVEAGLVQHSRVSAAVVVAWKDPVGHTRLVGHVVALEVAPDELRDHLRSSLPEYMVPVRFVFHDALPLTGSNKIDRAALPAPDSPDAGLADPGDQPHTETERKLAEIWARVLGLDEVGTTTSFFLLGGDSILSIRATNEARKSGLDVTARLMYDHPDIASLAAALDSAAERATVQAEQGTLAGPVPLTPVQHWFTQLVGPLNHFNQAVRLRWSEPPEVHALTRALDAVVTHHDALRLRLECASDGTWNQRIAATEGADLLQVVKLGDLRDEERTAAIEEAVAGVHARLDLREGPIVRAVLLRGGASRADELIVSIHHIAVDTVSWSIILDDLATAYQQHASVEPVVLPPKTTSYRQWSRRLVEYAVSDEFAPEAAYWRTMPIAGAALAADHDLGPNTEGSAVIVRRTLTAVDTEALLHAAPLDGGSINELLVTALVRAVGQRTGVPTVHMDLEGHGREPVFDDLDLSRTVGWFTALQPLLLELPEGGDIGRCLTAVREQLRTNPHHGIGQGVWQQLLTPARRHPGPPISLNYLSQVRSEDDGGGRPFVALEEIPGVLEHPDLQRAHLLDVSAVVVDNRLQADWTYSVNRHRQETVEGMADAFVSSLLEMVRHVRRAAEVPSRPGPLDRLFAGAPSVRLRQHRHGVTGLSIARIEDGEVTAAWAEGLAVPADEVPASRETIFQAGSVSKHVAAVTAVRLVREGLLDLDTDVDRYLRRWSPRGLDCSGPGRSAPTTVRGLLTHTSGLSLTNAYGYGPDDKRPSLVQILKGRAPATNEPLRAEAPAGTVYKYSNGNYALLQMVLEDLTGQPFAELVRKLVFEPLGMVDSGYGSEFLHARSGNLAVGHDRDGHPISGSWKIYPELAGAGLWTTAIDLARLGADIQRALTGSGSVVLDRPCAEGLLSTTQACPTYGLGTVVRPMVGDTWFGHIGNAAGYRCVTAVGINSGQGLVFMANSERGLDLVADVLADLGMDVPVIPAPSQ